LLAIILGIYKRILFIRLIYLTVIFVAAKFGVSPLGVFISHPCMSTTGYALEKSDCCEYEAGGY
jgi:hypothetical protein